MRSVPFVHTNRTTERPYTGFRSRLENTQAFDRHGKWFRNHCIIDDEIAPFADEQRATSELKEFLP